jgi:hypothetical protein
MKKRKKRISRKTQAHVEMILSMIIFVGIVFVVLFFLNPTSQTKLSSSILDKVQEKILNNVSINYQQVSLILYDEPKQDCFAINNSAEIDKTVVAKDLSGKRVGAETKANGKRIEIENASEGNNKFYRLYFSDSFNLSSPPTGCDPMKKENYTFSSLSFENAVLYENLVELNNLYLTDYSSLKDGLGIKDNFEFVVYNESWAVLLNDSLKEHKLKITNIISRDIPLMAMNKNADQQKIILNLRVW